LEKANEEKFHKGRRTYNCRIWCLMKQRRSPQKREERFNFEKRVQILRDFFSKKSVRGMRKNAGCSYVALARFLSLAGGAAKEYHSFQHDLPIKRILIDEMHIIVGGREKYISDWSRKNLGWGEYWIWVAMCADTGFVIATHVGKRTARDAEYFLHKIRWKLPLDADLQPLFRPTIITDGYAGYGPAVEKAFGQNVNFAQYIKDYTAKAAGGREIPGVDEHGELRRGATFSGATKVVRIGHVDECDIKTSRVEGAMSRYRRMLPRFGGKDPCYSKSLRAVEDAVALATFGINYLIAPETYEPVLRPDGTPELSKAGNPRKRRVHRDPPAVQLGLPLLPHARFGTAPKFRRWSLEALVSLVEGYAWREALNISSTEAVKNRIRAESASRKPLTANVSPFAFYVVWNRQHRTAKVHSSECHHARGAAAKTQMIGGTIQWFGLTDRQSATTMARRLEEHGYSECRMCLGQYHTLGRRL
jgi:IS1 family transposase